MRKITSYDGNLNSVCSGRLRWDFLSDFDAFGLLQNFKLLGIQLETKKTIRNQLLMLILYVKIEYVILNEYANTSKVGIQNCRILREVWYFWRKREFMFFFSCHRY